MQRTLIGYELLGQRDKGIPSVCAIIAGTPYPARGLAAGVVEVMAALFLPTALRLVVGGIGILRIIYGLGGLSE